jgi:hypothetical protein
MEDKYGSYLFDQINEGYYYECVMNNVKRHLYFICVIRPSTIEHYKLGAYIYFICLHHSFYGNT